MTSQCIFSVLRRAVFSVLVLALLAAPSARAMGSEPELPVTHQSCGENEIRLVGRIASSPEGTLLLQTEIKGQTEGPSYRLKFADEPLDPVTRDLLEQAEINKTPISVLGSFAEDGVFVVTAVVSGGRSGVSIGSQ